GTVPGGAGQAGHRGTFRSGTRVTPGTRRPVHVRAVVPQTEASVTSITRADAGSQVGTGIVRPAWRTRGIARHRTASCHPGAVRAARRAAGPRGSSREPAA